jgi:branched-chain amino acid transport system permease protein
VGAVAQPIALIVLLGVIVLLVQQLGGTALERQTIGMLIYVVAVVGLYTFVGNSGVLSFGHVTFMIVGAYVTALLTMTPGLKMTIFPFLPAWIAHIELSLLPGVLMGAFAAAALATVISVPITRLPAISAGLAMFALLLAANAAARGFIALISGGQNSFFGVPQDTSMASAFGFAALSIVLASAFQRSRVGLRLKASREDEFAAHASGINITANRVVAFILSGALMGVSGGLFVEFLGALAPDTLFLNTTLITIAMLVVGGMYSLSGAVAGTVVLSMLAEVLRQVESATSRPGLSSMGFAVTMLLILVFRPSGITDSRELSNPLHWRLPFRKRRTEPAEQQMRHAESRIAK